MDYNKMINIKRETNVNDNAFAMPPNKKSLIQMTVADHFTATI